MTFYWITILSTFVFIKKFELDAEKPALLYENP